MSDKPETEKTDPSIEELITGIGKLVYKLNESVVQVDKRLEKLETGISSLLTEKFESVTSELVKSNEYLAGFGTSIPVGTDGVEKTEVPASEPSETPSSGLIDKLDELKIEVTGIRKDLSGAEKKLLKALSDGPDGSLSEKVFKKELSEVSVMISESASSLQKTVTDVAEKSDENRGTVLSENLKPLTDEMEKISVKLDDARDSVQNKLEEIQTATANEVGIIGDSVKESTESQDERLEQMRELLELHSVEVKDDRVRNLNRAAIVHFNNAEYDQAMSNLEEALAISPDSSELLANIAHIEASLQELDKAEEHFRQALEIDPDLEPAISGLGAVLVMTGRSSDTIDFLQKYLEEGSEASTGIMIALSRAYAVQENHEKALKLLEQAEMAAPGHPGLEQELARYRS